MPTKTGLDPTDRPLPDLGPRQAECLQVIKDYKASHNGNSPTVRELQSLLGLKSTFSPRELLRSLEEKGRIVRAPGNRNIMVIER